MQSGYPLWCFTTVLLAKQIDDHDFIDLSETSLDEEKFKVVMKLS